MRQGGQPVEIAAVAGVCSRDDRSHARPTQRLHPGKVKRNDGDMATDKDFDIKSTLGQLPDWRVLVRQLVTRYRTGSFVTGLEFVSRVASAAEAANHHPDVDLRYGHVDIRLFTHDEFALTKRDTDLATQISQIAANMGLTSEPRVLSRMEIVLDTHDMVQIKPFWQAVLKMQGHPKYDEELLDPTGCLPGLWFQTCEPHELPQQRFHLDLWVARDEVQARIDAGLAAGGVVVSTSNAPEFTVLADAQGNKVCVCTVPDK